MNIQKMARARWFSLIVIKLKDSIKNISSLFSGPTLSLSMLIQKLLISQKMQLMLISFLKFLCFQLQEDLKSLLQQTSKVLSFDWRLQLIKLAQLIQRFWMVKRILTRLMMMRRKANKLLISDICNVNLYMLYSDIFNFNKT